MKDNSEYNKIKNFRKDAKMKMKDEEEKVDFFSTYVMKLIFGKNFKLS